MTGTTTEKPLKRKAGCWTIGLVLLIFCAVVSTIWTLVAPNRRLGAVPPPVEGAAIHWYERKNDDYVLEERRVITKVEEGYVTMTRPDGNEIRVPRVKYDTDARE